MTWITPDRPSPLKVLSPTIESTPVPIPYDSHLVIVIFLRQWSGSVTIEVTSLGRVCRSFGTTTSGLTSRRVPCPVLFLPIFYRDLPVVSSWSYRKSLDTTLIILTVELLHTSQHSLGIRGRSLPYLSFGLKGKSRWGVTGTSYVGHRRLCHLDVMSLGSRRWLRSRYVSYNQEKEFQEDVGNVVISPTSWSWTPLLVPMSPPRHGSLSFLSLCNQGISY